MCSLVRSTSTVLLRARCEMLVSVCYIRKPTSCLRVCSFVATTETAYTVQIISRIVGEEELPWEGEGRAKELLKRAGRYKDAVLGLLRRDPQQRTRVQTFMQQYASILSTTTQQPASTTTSFSGQGGRELCDSPNPPFTQMSATHRTF